MPRYFTQYVSNPTWSVEKSIVADDPVLKHTAGNLFLSHGVLPGDILYLVTVKEGALLVAGKMEVEKVCGREEAAVELGTDNLWNASEHVIGSAGTPKNFDLSVPRTTTEGLRFVTALGIRPLKFESRGRLDKQTLRGVREIDAASAAELDKLLPPLERIATRRNEPFDYADSFPEGIVDSHDYYEGSARSVTVNVYERNAKARASCIAHYGDECFVCRFSFKSAYGVEGEGFIHVHHLKALSEIGEEYRLDPIRDLRPVCPNCHAMIHRKNPPYTIEELKNLIGRVRNAMPFASPSQRTG